MAGATVTVEQISKDFPFGSAIAKSILGNLPYQVGIAYFRIDGQGTQGCEITSRMIGVRGKKNSVKFYMGKKKLKGKVVFGFHISM